jgi:tetratricopeptide (TPR) repeat protein|nr:tetratricopeptide repeat protein [Butyrivibrio sp.]
MDISNNKQIEKGLMFLKEEKYYEAYAAFEAASKEDKSLDLPFYYMAVILTRRKEFDKAFGLAKIAMENDYSNKKSRNLKAFLLIKLDRVEDAKEAVKENLEYDPNDYMSHQMSLKFEVGRYIETAWIDYMKLIRYVPKACLDIARTYLEWGMYDEAGYSAETAFDFDKYPIHHYYRGACKILTGHYDIDNALLEFEHAERCMPSNCYSLEPDDIKILEVVIENATNSAKACYYLGLIYLDLKEYELAAKYFAKSIEQDGSFALAKEKLEIAREKNCLDKKADIEE